MRFAVPYDNVLKIAEETGESMEILFHEIREMGFHALDIRLVSLSKDVYDLAKKNGLTIEVGRFVHNFFSGAKAIEAESALDIAKEYGITTLVVLPGLLPDGEKKVKDTFYQEAVLELSKFANMAKEKGLKVAFTNINLANAPYETPYEIERLCKEATGISLSLSMEHLFMNDENSVLVMKKDLYSYITHLTVGDVNVDNLEYGDVPLYHHGEKTFYRAPIGDGDVPMRTLFITLDELGYKGYVTIESNLAKDSLQCLADSMNFIREKCHK